MPFEVGAESKERDTSVLLVVPVVPKRVLDTTEFVGHVLRCHEVLTSLEGEAAFHKRYEQGATICKMRRKDIRLLDIVVPVPVVSQDVLRFKIIGRHPLRPM